MDRLIIRGGKPLRGKVKISGAKNAALPSLVASILTSEPIHFSRVPNLRDVHTVCTLLSNLGVRVKNRGRGNYELESSQVQNYEAPYDLVKTMRASCLVMGPLLTRFGKAKVSYPGGCAIGERPINLHIKGFKLMGAKVKLHRGYVVATAKNGLRGNSIYLDLPTVTGTQNLMMAATLAKGETIIENVAREPEVCSLARMLNDMGAKIAGAGTDVVTIQGVPKLHGTRCKIIPDRIETGTYMVAGAITGGDVEVVQCDPETVDSVVAKLRETGCKVQVRKSSIRVKGNAPLRSVDISTAPYPGFPTDMQAQIMALMTLSDGVSVINETVFENRFMHVAELNRMGATVHVQGSSATVKGVPKLSGAPLTATDLRASASLVLAALAADGESVVHRVYHLNRGYESLVDKLTALGADIERVSGPPV